MTAADKTKLNGLKKITDDNDIVHDATGQTNTGGAKVKNAFVSIDNWSKTHTAAASRPHGELKQADKDNDVNLGGAGADNAKVASQLAIKTYVDGKITGAAPEPYDPTGPNAGNYPKLHWGAPIKKGDIWIISKAGNLGPVPKVAVVENDTVIADKDAPGNAHADWTVIHTNIVVNEASETVKGVMEIATQAETDAGTDDLRAVTPAKLKGAMVDKKFTTAFNVQADDPKIMANHALGTTDVIVNCYKLTGTATPKEQIDAEIHVTNLDTVTAEINITKGDFTWEVVVIGSNRWA